MGDLRTRPEIDGFVGHAPERCTPASPRDELCTWLLTGRDAAWRPLASMLGSSDRLNLLCVVPRDSGARAPGSCSVHPRRSDRRRWSPAPQSGAAQKRQARHHQTESREEFAVRAQAEIAQASDLAALSRLVGDAPDQCSPADAALVCVWRASNQTYGHGILAASIQASVRKKVRMSCVLPDDGSARDADSCAVVVGY